VNIFIPSDGAVDIAIFRDNINFAGIGYGFGGVGYEVHNGFRKMDRGARYVQQFGRQSELEINLAVKAFQFVEFRCFLKIGYDSVHIDHFVDGDAPSGQSQQILDDGGSLHARFFDFHNRICKGALWGNIHQQ